jgi:replicative DNA helicase
MEQLDLRHARERIKAEWDLLTKGEGRDDEVDDLFTWLVGQEKGNATPNAVRAGLAAAPTTPPTPTPPDIQMSKVIGGGAFVQAQPPHVQPRWGKGSDVLWAQGESLLIVGPTGVGKTTIGGQVIAGLTGLVPDVLGFPVQQARKVLYLAMDRPKQIARAWHRLFSSTQLPILDAKVAVWRGPLPMRMGDHPELLLELARTHDADVIIIDSLKDLEPELDKPSGGGAVNAAIQHCNASDIDVLALHHQRKSVEGKKPTTLEDVFGSTWLTAGSGSVILLWGEAGSEQIELTHLKQPADPIGPLRIEHDHLAGTSTVTTGWDALGYLRLRGSGGASLAEAVQAHHGNPQKPGNSKWKQTERRLRRLVRDGSATTAAQPGVGQSARYTAVISPSKTVP